MNHILHSVQFHFPGDGILQEHFKGGREIVFRPIQTIDKVQKEFGRSTYGKKRSGPRDKGYIFQNTAIHESL